MTQTVDDRGPLLRCADAGRIQQRQHDAPNAYLRTRIDQPGQTLAALFALRRRAAQQWTIHEIVRTHGMELEASLGQANVQPLPARLTFQRIRAFAIQVVHPFNAAYPR